ncbi:MAG: thioesterase [Turicibacter sp.]|nr:thioesterase [Turicibacter sp.]
MIYKNELTLDFYDTNARNEVTLTALLKRINLAAGANALEIGVSMQDTLQWGLTFVLERFAVTIFEYPQYMQTATIRTWPAEIARGVFRRNGDMWHKDKKIAEWTALWVLIDINERKVKRPKALPITLPAYGLLDVSTETTKIVVPVEASIIASYSHIVRFSDLDANNHMNSAIYGDLISNLLETAHINSAGYRFVNLNYFNEAKLNDEIKVECRQLKNTLYISGNTEKYQVFAALLEFPNL